MIRKSRYDMPEEAAIYRATWWSSADAAKAWGCSRATAYRWFTRHPETVKRVRLWYTEYNRMVHKRVIPAGFPRHPSRRGNPMFRDPAYQRELIGRRHGRAQPQPKHTPKWQ